MPNSSARRHVLEHGVVTVARLRPHVVEASVLDILTDILTLTLTKLRSAMLEGSGMASRVAST